tara:strand:- start:8137 stop:9351 length:1215 start_codon:yes stop_codon:yes gene_type:complete
MQSNLPSLRFPEFRGDWERKTLGSIASFAKGKGITKSDISADGHIKCIRYGELYTYYSELAENIKSSTHLNEDDLVLSLENDVLIPASGESAIDMATATCVKEKGLGLGGDINIIRSSLDGTFLAYYLNNSKRIDIARYAQGISVIHLYAAQLKLLKMCVPPTNDEAAKLGEFFSKIDENISLLNGKLNVLKNYKVGLLQKLFKQEVRFNNKDGGQFPDWERRKFKDFITVEGKYPQGNDLSPLASLTIENGIEAKSARYVRDFLVNDEKEAYKLVDPEHFVINPMNLRFGAIAKNNAKNTVKISKYYDVFSVDDSVNAHYFELYLKSYEMMKTYHRTATGTLEEKKRVHFSEFILFEKMMPCKKEQDKISEIIASFDNSIENLVRKIDAIIKFKKSLIQQMFL